MNGSEPKQNVPLTRDDDGVFRVTGTRVTLDSIVHQFRAGATAEQTQEDFPTLKLSDIYSVIAYYLQNPATVEKYLAEQKQSSEGVRKTWERDPAAQELKDRLRQRRTKAAA